MSFSGRTRGSSSRRLSLEAFEKPEWIGEEVSGDPRYYNSNLVAHPYSEWK